MKTYSPSNQAWNVIADDNVEVTDDQFQALFEAQGTGMQIVPGPEGFPIAAASSPFTREQIERLRNTAYSDIQTGTDRLFSEVSRMKLMGEAGWEEAQAIAVVRYKEIQKAFPWPADE